MCLWSFKISGMDYFSVVPQYVLHIVGDLGNRDVSQRILHVAWCSIDCEELIETIDLWCPQ